jgi:tetratricopeptide (TPR) repeat protein
MGSSSTHVRRQSGRSPGHGAARAGGTTTLEPRLQRILDLQRDAGNSAVVQMIHDDEAADDDAQGGDPGEPSAAGPEEAEDPEVVEKAKAIFENGAKYYNAGAYARAFDEFERAYELTQRPGVAFSMAQALRRIGGRREEAIGWYQAYLDSGETKRAEESKAFIKELSTPASTGDLEADEKVGKAMFEKGARRYEARDYAHAYDEFMRSYELTARPSLLFSAAQALRRLGGRREEALDLYKRYLRDGDGKRAADTSAAIAELSTPASTGDIEQDTETGRGIFNKGAKFYEAGDYAHAYDEFSRSYELTERPQLLFSRAQALRRLGGRRQEAMELFQAYLDAGVGERQADARKFLEELAVPEAGAAQ